MKQSDSVFNLTSTHPCNKTEAYLIKIKHFVFMTLKSNNKADFFLTFQK